MASERDTSSPPARSPLRFELLLGTALVLFGFVLLPSLIYMVGIALLGEYSGGGRLGAFYGDVFRDLSQGSPQAWGLVLGPLILVEAVRLIFLNFGSQPATEAPAPKTPASAGKSRPATRERREPTLRL